MPRDFAACDLLNFAFTSAWRIMSRSWAGNGGSMSYVDLDARMSLAYYPNRWISGQHEMDRARLAIQAAYESLAAANGRGELRVSRVAWRLATCRGPAVPAPVTPRITDNSRSP